ncbi:MULTISPECIES: SDR family NAD(P)-dependent oxidoreductase [unclassified Streptomyces]|uniref:SDR family NAD(P)-dependent oxidoreductase n=1 Tax=unclassified Streptomyces TaxID=2593676 RepID=UPI000BACAFB9|nr:MULTISPECIES: SDR family oxidoreductase [unclassified Streptomyces]ASY36235.1 gluconate 5-dehydrogenase [Streptomyces sp. CLI2509]MYX22887.1 SDR family oxidoreductase [Streptomyces sp. SID8380]
MDRFDLTGRTALVTGAAGALGRAFALALAEAGADLLLVDLPGAEGLDETAHAVRAAGRAAALHPQDLARTDELPAFADRVRATAGPVHILVNNAGVAALERFNTITPASWRHVMRVNTDAVFFLSQRFAEHMIADGVPGRIINITSKNAHVAEAGLAHYNASKAAVDLLSKTLAIELAPHGITVNTLAPGMVDTPIDDAFPLAHEEFEAAYRARIPLGRYASPEECAGPLLLLASDAGAYVTGTHLLVDGGVLADQMPRTRFMPPYRSGLPTESAPPETP